ncbi:3-deoxy-D-manno-octulosonic acid transferase [Loktanella salsilacus]|uniref:3-deoxy-D-manno-octulosonic acid transferase n=1 Tax=Loktanella salsilacus TaxID=195913 RepID=UPI003736E91A
MEAVVWARCATPADAAVIAALDARLKATGEDVGFAITTQDHPEGRRAVRAHLAKLKPMLLLWIGGPLDTTTLSEAKEAGVPIVVIDLDETALDGIVSRWFPSRSRGILSQLHTVYTREQACADAFIAAGAPADRTFAVGLLEDPPAVLPYIESDRRDLAESLRNRPIWLATQTEAADVTALAAAQRLAARRSHRLMLVAVAARAEDGPALVSQFEAQGLPASLRSLTSEPEEATQVHVVDTPAELGLWLRLATVAFAGGTLTQRAAQDPFEAAALGSVLIHGQRTAPYTARYDRLARAGATLQVDGEAGLGRAVEALLSADRVAAMAMAGWDVTSRGAEATDRIVTLIRNRLDEAGL